MDTNQIPNSINEDSSLPLQTPVGHQPVFTTKNFLLVVMAILLLIATSLAGFFYFQTQKLSKELSKYQTQASPAPIASLDPTANWKIYMDPKSAYEFKYPPEYSLSKDVGILNDPTMHYIFSVSTFETKLSSEEWIKEKRCITHVDANNPYGCSDYTNGPIKNSTQFTVFAHYGSINTVVKHGDIIFEINMDAREPNPKFEQEIKDTYSQILSTFKFLGQNDEVLGIQINTCCSCPTKIDKSLIGTDGWVIYERGKNYSSLLPDECKRVDCAPCPPLEETSAKAKECYAKTQCEGPMPCMANPASVFCTCMGGKLEIRENDQGQYGVCLIDGQEYDEWEYFRTMNPEDKKYSQ